MNDKGEALLRHLSAWRCDRKAFGSPCGKPNLCISCQAREALAADTTDHADDERRAAQGE